MVFRKKATRAVRRYFGKAARRSSHRSSGSISPMNMVLAGAIYGAARPFAAKMLPDMFSFGPVDSDNVLIGAAGWYGMKKGKGLMKALGAIALGSEMGIVAARLAAPVAQNVSTQVEDTYNY